MQPLYQQYRTKASTYRTLHATTAAEKRAAVETRRRALSRSKPGRSILQRNAVSQAKRAATIAQKQSNKPIPTTQQRFHYRSDYNYVVTITAMHIPTNEISLRPVTIAAEHPLTSGELSARVMEFMENIPSMRFISYTLDAAYHA